MEKVHKEIGKLKGVKEAKMVTGPYDIKVETSGSSIRDILDTTVNKIRNIKGVKNTMTCIYIDSELPEEFSEVLKNSK